MIKFLFPALLMAAPVAAQDIPTRLAEQGLAPTEAYLASLSDPDPTERFALGAVRFLGAIETTLQTRWRLGMNADFSELPVLRLPVPPNREPAPFTPETIPDLFETLIADLDAARAPLLQIADDDAVALTIPLYDLWFDINMNGTRDDGEGVIGVAGRTLTGRGLRTRFDSDQITFDTADAAWLAAYTHFVSAFAELVLAFAPVDQISYVLDLDAQMDGLAADTQYQSGLDMLFGAQADRLAMIYFALRNQPDPAHTRAAHGHLLQMIAQNRVFWARVWAETDNTGEWVPNNDQDQGLGFWVPPGTGERWLAVLDDAEALLKGEKLIPHWRFRSGAGLNLRRMFEEPRPIDIAEWIHGVGVMPYVEEGTRISRDNWLDFRRLVRGEELLYVVFLN